MVFRTNRDIMNYLALDILRHNAIRDCLFDLGLKAGMTVRKEPQHLLCDGTGDKPADVLFASFSQGRDLCVNVTPLSIYAT
jgi:hypothetical protein